MGLMEAEGEHVICPAGRAADATMQIPFLRWMFSETCYQFQSETKEIKTEQSSSLRKAKAVK